MTATALSSSPVLPGLSGLGRLLLLQVREHGPRTQAGSCALVTWWVLLTYFLENLKISNLEGTFRGRLQGVEISLTEGSKISLLRPAGIVGNTDVSTMDGQHSTVGHHEERGLTFSVIITVDTHILRCIVHSVEPSKNGRKPTALMWTSRTPVLVILNTYTHTHTHARTRRRSFHDYSSPVTPQRTGTGMWEGSIVFPPYLFLELKVYYNQRCWGILFFFLRQSCHLVQDGLEVEILLSPLSAELQLYCCVIIFPHCKCVLLSLLIKTRLT